MRALSGGSPARSGIWKGRQRERPEQLGLPLWENLDCTRYMPGRLGVYLPYLNCLHEYLNQEIRRQAEKSRPVIDHVRNHVLFGDRCLSHPAGPMTWS